MLSSLLPYTVGAEERRDYASLKIALPPGRGRYIGQSVSEEADIATFKAAIGKRTALWYKAWAISYEPQRPVFYPDVAEEDWRQGKSVMVAATVPVYA